MLAVEESLPFFRGRRHSVQRRPLTLRSPMGSRLALVRWPQPGNRMRYKKRRHCVRACNIAASRATRARAEPVSVPSPAIERRERVWHARIDRHHWGTRLGYVGLYLDWRATQRLRLLPETRTRRQRETRDSAEVADNRRCQAAPSTRVG